MKDDDGIRIQVRPVARTRAQGERDRRYHVAQKCAVVILVAALVSVVAESWGLSHPPAEFAGAVCGMLAQRCCRHGCAGLRWHGSAWRRQH